MGWFVLGGVNGRNRGVFVCKPSIWFNFYFILININIYEGNRGSRV